MNAQPAAEVRNVGAVAFDVTRFLEAVAEVESGGDNYAVGPKGEVSKFQILPSTWRSLTPAPLSFASDPRYSFPVARKHLFEIRQALHRAKIKETVWTLARSWNPKGTDDEATRITNIYHDYDPKTH